MATTLNKMSDQILRLYYQGNRSDDAKLTRQEIKELVCQAINNVLKAESIGVNYPLGEAPAHALIATYTNQAVTATGTPTQEVVCTDMDSEGITVGGPDMEVTVFENETSTEYYTIQITGITWGGTDAATVQAFIEACPDSAVLQFAGVTSVPSAFYVAGIQDLVVTTTTLTFTYYPYAIPTGEIWATAEGDGYITADTFFWGTGDSTITAINPPTLLANLVAATHALLDAIASSETYSDYDFTNLQCCEISTDAASLDSYVTLPAQPIHLPRQLGVWRVWGTDPNDPFIPLTSTQYALTSKIGHTNMATILGSLTAYEYYDNKTLRFNQPVSTVGSTVNIQLLVVDPTKLAGTDLLPVHADMENTVINMVLEQLGVTRQPGDVINDEIDVTNGGSN